ncbi:MAG TPA: hypothetical protein PKN08_04585 [Opitutaceae bacterium]|jgi:hypothetical protein|nr:hypothetical protein [Opitutaceae bacterium]
MAVGTLKSNAFGFHAINPAMSIPLMEGYEKASQTFKDGAILKRDSGQLAVAGADNTADIIGVAAAPASGVTDAKRQFVLAAGNIFEATLEDETNTDHALVKTNLYTDYAAQVDSSGNYYVDENDTTNPCVMIVGANKSDIDAATVRARVLCVFLADALAQQT